MIYLEYKMMILLCGFCMLYHFKEYMLEEKTQIIPIYFFRMNIKRMAR